MNWNQYEISLLARNPGLREPQGMMRITAQSFLAQLEKTFLAGRVAEQEIQQAGQAFRSPFDAGIFGMFR